MEVNAVANYDPAKIEEYWQKQWEDEDFYRSEIDDQKTKYYVLEMFPYPSGKLHMGHMRVYSIGDVLARFLRMRGYNVIHPMGWDAFGLPAENAAIEHKVNPAQWTAQNIEHMKKQQNRLGVSYDWHREVNTSAPDYYRWSQWLFLLMYKRDLAYKKKASVNWCNTCLTVLANEQVEKGLCWRCSSVVETRELEQWFLRITEYAERLLYDLEKLEEWPERVKIMQHNWIGRSEGAEITFKIKEFPDKEIKTFTTRPDTLFGVTSMVLAPEHPMVRKLVEGTEQEAEILEFAARVKKESEIERTADEAPKIGLFTGRHVINPINGEEVPVLVGNYVLMGYGTGAVMGVPAHDQRDFVFARKHNLPVRVVIQPEGEALDGDTMTEAYPGEGKMVNSGPFSGLDSITGKKMVTEKLKEQGLGRFQITYRLRDWLISRQRYWGAPIPIIYCEKCGTVPVPEADLPVELPRDVKLSGNRVPSLSHYEGFVHADCPVCGEPARRETDTMDTFICSSWYFLRYTSPGSTDAPFDQEAVDYWMPVDQYIGGIEHAVLHLLYARFFTKVLFDADLIKAEEPFSRLLAQGMVYKDGAKMSKSKGNVVTPDEIVEKYGADTGRLFILFASPPEKDLDWSDQGVEGCNRFLRRIWRLVDDCLEEFAVGGGAVESGEKEADLQRAVHASIKKVTTDIQDRFNFNTAISSIMELVNSIYAYRQSADNSAHNQAVMRDALEKTILILAPFAPHLAEESWRLLGFKESVHRQQWPDYDPEKLLVEEVEVVVQVNGKVRGRVTVAVDCPEEQLIEEAKAVERVGEQLAGKEIVRVITVPGRLVNIVIR
jgi:leucyl-tRNA synthetase